MNRLPVGVLLAAGNSERFGSNKLLYPLHNNRPMLLQSAQKLVSVLPVSIAVISQQLAATAKDLEQLGLRVVINPHSPSGMGSSIACGVRESADASGWLITLADMPYVEVATIEQLVKKMLAGAAMVAPFFGQQRGHPVGFHHQYHDELVSLDGDSGARQVINNHLPLLERVVTSDRGVIIDIDSQQDLESVSPQREI